MGRSWKTGGTYGRCSSCPTSKLWRASRFRASRSGHGRLIGCRLERLRRRFSFSRFQIRSALRSLLRLFATIFVSFLRFSASGEVSAPTCFQAVSMFSLVFFHLLFYVWRCLVFWPGLRTPGCGSGVLLLGGSPVLQTRGGVQAYSVPPLTTAALFREMRTRCALP